MMAAEHWFRWHHGCVTDPKFRVIALRCVTSVTVGHVIAIWAAMLECASQATPRGELVGWDDEDVAVLFGFTADQVSGIREAMQGKTLDGNRLIAWENRQPARNDDSKDRVREFRERQRHVTQSNAPKRDVTLETETETETEKKDQQQERGTPRAAANRGTRLPADWTPSELEMQWAKQERPDLDAGSEAERFADYWHGVAGPRGVKLDWAATWRNWIRRSDAPKRHGFQQPQLGTPRKRRELGA